MSPGSNGNVDIGGTITAGSGNEVITLSTGKIDADALTLTAAVDGGTGTSSGSGLIVRSDGIGLLQGCSDGQVLKWVESTDTWDCAAGCDRRRRRDGRLAQFHGVFRYPVSRCCDFDRARCERLYHQPRFYGDFAIEDGGTPFVTFNDDGTITLAGDTSVTGGKDIRFVETGGGTDYVASRLRRP